MNTATDMDATTTIETNANTNTTTDMETTTDTKTEMEYARALRFPDIDKFAEEDVDMNSFEYKLAVTHFHLVHCADSILGMYPGADLLSLPTLTSALSYVCGEGSAPDGSEFITEESVLAAVGPMLLNLPSLTGGGETSFDLNYVNVPRFLRPAAQVLLFRVNKDLAVA